MFANHRLLGLTLSTVGFFVGLLALSPFANAGLFEISANGFFNYQDMGVIEGHKSFTNSRRMGGGLAYHFTEQTSAELNYTDSADFETVGFAQVSQTAVKHVYTLDTRSRFKNASLDLVLAFADKNAGFRPYVMGGVGYMTRRKARTGSEAANAESAGGPIPEYVYWDTKSASADGGLGFRIIVMQQLSFDVRGTLYASDLDKAQVYLQYAVTGGLRFMF